MTPLTKLLIVMVLWHIVFGLIFFLCAGQIKVSSTSRIPISQMHQSGRTFLTIKHDPHFWLSSKGPGLKTESLRTGVPYLQITLASIDPRAFPLNQLSFIIHRLR